MFGCQLISVVMQIPECWTSTCLHVRPHEIDQCVSVTTVGLSVPALCIVSFHHQQASPDATEDSSLLLVTHPNMTDMSNAGKQAGVHAKLACMLTTDSAHLLAELMGALLMCSTVTEGQWKRLVNRTGS